MSPLRVWFVSPNFPPEVCPQATRIYEHAREWVRLKGEVDVLTDNPSYPEGVVYDGYENRFTQETVDGIRVHRLPMYLAPNEGSGRRIASFVSFMFSVLWHARRVGPRPDIVAATSPQFFCAVGGYLLARRLRVPFMLEIRDLWPESIVAVGAMRRGRVVRFLEAVERHLYRHADHVVVVTDSFVEHVTARGARPENVTVLKNGVDLERFDAPLDEAERAALRARHGWDGKFVAAYVGTIGMAHRANIMLEAAARCPDPDVMWVVIGTGAERAALEQRAAAEARPNFALLDKQPRERIRYYLAETDVSVVHLRDTPLFRSVLPSKIFEAMALRTPIVLGVRGEAQALVEEAGAGLTVPPEDPDALVEAVLRLKRDRALYARLAEDGGRFVRTHFDRRLIARRYWDLLARVARGAPAPSTAPQAE